MKHTRQLYKAYVAILAVAALVAAVGALFAATVATESSAATQAVPVNTGEPSISGTAMVGQVLRTTRGLWSGTEPIDYSFRWFRCQGRGAPDASDCRRIANASDNTYVLRQADVGFSLRSQVVARNADGQATATSNPTATVVPARPRNVDEPSISGTPVVGARLQADRGRWIGEQPLTYSYVWLRCTTEGRNCSEIQGANDTDYEVRDADLGRTIRVRVTARNDAGTASAVSNATAVVANNAPPSGAIDVASLQAAGDRLVVAQVRFAPNPVTSRTTPISARVQITARSGRPVSGALVFMRGTPRVVTGQTQPTGSDGWATLTLVPNRYFPQPRDGFNVQFFVKASRRGDPPLGGIAGYRLVQVRLAGGA